MLQQERKQCIIEMINRDRIVKASDLVERFGVSMETVRRDLEELEKNGSLRRVYGGAVLGTVYDPEPSYNNRQITHAEQKKAIAVAAYGLIEPGDTLFLDGGTTLMELATCIANGSKRGLTVITNAINIACEVIKNADCNVILLGGSLTRGEPLTTGVLCNSNLHHFHANKIIMGAAGISEKYGVTDFSVDVGASKRDMLKRSDEIVCLADFSKFGVNATNCICTISEVDTLVTDWMTPREDYSYFLEAGVKVVSAPESQTREPVKT